MAEYSSEHEATAVVPPQQQHQDIASNNSSDPNGSRWTLKRNVSFTDNNNNGNSGSHGHSSSSSSSSCSANPGSNGSKRSKNADGRDSWDVQQTMATMDRRYGTKFVDWVQSEENLDCAASHLRKIAKEYDVKKVGHCIG